LEHCEEMPLFFARTLFIPANHERVVLRIEGRE